MTSPIYDELERLLGHAGLELHDDADRVKTWLTRHIHPHPYHQQQQNTERTPTVSLLDDITSELTALQNDAASAYQHGKTVLEQHLPGIVNVVSQAEQDAAKLARFESEPIITDIMGIFEAAIPGARELLTPAVAVLKGLASAAAPAAPVEAAPAEPAPAA